MIDIDKVLEAAGFDFSIRPENETVVLSVEGGEGAGKTELACSAPDPILFQGLDGNEDGVVQKWQRGTDDREQKKIAWLSYSWKLDHKLMGIKSGEEYKKAKELQDLQAEEIRAKVWNKFTNDYLKAIKAGFKTIVWDTATEVWELVRLANYGRVAQIPETAYPAMNAEFKELVKAAREAKINLVLLHQQRPVYDTKVVIEKGLPKEKRIKTSKVERAGMSKLGYLVDVYVENRFVPPARDKEGNPTAMQYWVTKVLNKCKNNPEAVGVELMNARWEDLMALVGPASLREAASEGAVDLDLEL